MKVRFGEFPENHHFLQLARPFVEWTFKFFGWLVIVSTVQFAQERTGNQILLYVKWFSYLLILVFLGTFVDWVLSFERYKTISGRKLANIAMAGPKPDIKEEGRLKKLSSRAFLKIRRVSLHWLAYRLPYCFLVPLISLQAR